MEDCYHRSKGSNLSVSRGTRNLAEEGEEKQRAKEKIERMAEGEPSNVTVAHDADVMDPTMLFTA